VSGEHPVENDIWQNLGEAVAKLVAKLRKRVKAEAAPAGKQEPLSSPGRGHR
jgi:hypothetical protein